MKTIFTLIFCLSFSIAMAQSNPDPSFDRDEEINDFSEETNYDWSWKQERIPFAPPPPPVPIDGGLGFLLAAGLAYGLRSMKRRK